MDDPRPDVLGLLEPEEEVLAFTWARVPGSRTSGTTFASILALIVTFDFLRNRIAMRHLRKRSQQYGLPLERRMAMCATNQRLLVWGAARSRRRVGPLLFALPRSRIISASLPFVGGARWRTIQLQTAEGALIRLQVRTSAAESLISALAN